MDKLDHGRMPKLTDICADDGEVLAAAVLRFIASGYMTGDVACWDAAFDGAERVLGAAEAPHFVASMASVMRAIRAERRQDWQFLPATCCRVTEDECHLIGLLALARQERWDAVNLGAAQLAGADSAPRLAASLRLAAEALDFVASRLPGAYATRPAGSALH